ncbi:MAG: pyruvate dehydrogenase (acetyl-transferring), homodimeric type [Acidimicrobiia bacterium]|nr:pyruvate dehydrogenase (acetyl-transferring), homodimeric type [Acidimicrobiia bacterium]
MNDPYNDAFASDYVHAIPDPDPVETQEWIESLDAVVDTQGEDRAVYLISRLLDRAHDTHLHAAPAAITTPYINTIPAEDEPEYPGDAEIERRIRRYVRWNAAVMVIKANDRSKGIGGHLSTFASSATLYEVGFNHFFRGKNNGPGDHIYIQGHASPGVYGRAYLENRLDDKELDNFRFEIGDSGLSSYPHPRLMPDFWEYPTVSMGLGPINSIYQARFNKYMHNRGLDDTTDSRVWCFIGDGEVDEPETLGAISLATREGLNNLTWVINANLQRLDGPVRGNGKIIQELEAVFRGAGWNVIKLIWGTNWDPLLAADKDGSLVEVMNNTLDGEYQRYKAEDGAFVREKFFGKHPNAAALVEDWSDEEIWALRRGGLDYRKIYSAYHAATTLDNGRPTVILAKTIKGWTLGPDVEGRNATHQIKQLTNQQLLELRETLELYDEIPEDALAGESTPPYYRPDEGSVEHRYLMEHREKLGGSLPSRPATITQPLQLPGEAPFEEMYAGSGKVEASTTTAFTRLLRGLAREENFGPRVVPIVPDEARTFGMDSLFRELKIYASRGQLYEPVDAKMLLSYAEGQDGQILEEGITEAGSAASWIAAGTSYATRGVPMVPFFIFYSMFGFQRVGDLLWSAADSRTRGFLLGGTAGRTTLEGEGLQHQDGHSLLLASTVPTCQAYDPAFAYEVGVIIRDGLHRMYGENPEDIYYYLTLYNENFAQPPKPDGVDQGVIDGLYRWKESPEGVDHKATVLFSGTANLAARRAADELAEHFGIGVDLWSATSYKLLREQAMTTERWNRLHPDAEPRTSQVASKLADLPGPIVAVSDFMKAVPDQISQWVPGPFATLGTDGFGRSDNREALRDFFETDHRYVVATVISELIRTSGADPDLMKDVLERYRIDPDRPDPRLSF